MKGFSMPSIQEMDHLIKFCTVMSQAPFYQKLGPGGVLAIYMTAKEHDLPFMSCMNGGLYTFDGKVTFSAIMINALILKAGHTADILEINEDKCVIQFTRGDRKNDPHYQPYIHEFNRKDAERAGYLKKDNWKNSLKDMFYCRALTGGGRKHIPEVFVGVLVAGELVGDDRDSKIQPLLPPEASLKINEPAKTETIMIDHQKAESFAEFMNKHRLYESQDGIKSRKLEYICLTADKCKMSKMKIINHAITNEVQFEKMFNDWEKENYPAPEDN